MRLNIAELEALIDRCNCAGSNRTPGGGEITAADRSRLAIYILEDLIKMLLRKEV